MSEQHLVLDPVNQSLIEQLAAHASSPVYSLSPEEARSSLVAIQSALRADTVVHERTIDSGAQILRLRTIRPRSAPDRAPVIMYFHGGGWVLGDATTHDRLVTELAVGANAVLVFVDYHRAPEYQYPVAVEQAYAATRYVAAHPEEFNVDATRLVVAGDSAGGNIATVVALLAQMRSGPAIAGQLLFYPATNADFETESYKQFADGPWLTRRAMQWFWDQYVPDANMRKDPTVSPLLASLKQLAGSPRTLIVTAENDVLRDEGEAYGRKLMEAGVEVVVTRYDGTIHDFLMLNALSHAAPTRTAITQAIEFLRSATAMTTRAR